MSNSSSSSSFFQDFLADYLAECEEHLALIRRELLGLESFIEQPQVEDAIVQSLFRSFHTLKGLSAMMGVKEAEQLAHHLESYLRVLREHQTVLTANGFDALMNGTKLLEHVIAAQSTHNPIPDLTPVLKQLQDVTSDTSVQPTPTPSITPTQLQLNNDQTEQITQALNHSQRVWHFVFSPSTELSERGIGVNIIRERLQTLGSFIHVAPRMMPNSQIVFDFILATSEAETTFAPWKTDGLTWEPYNPPATLPPNPPPQDEKIDAEPQPPLAPLQPALITPSMNMVRVDLPKLDELMRMVGNLVISRARLEDNLKRLTQTLPASQMRPLQEINLTLERQLRDLRQGVMEVRLVPIGEVFARMQFVVRDLARSSQKQILLEIQGEDTEIDKFVVEQIVDPLLHLVRNAVSHGIESPEERQQVGKSPVGKIWLKAATSGEMVVIEVADDGRGVNKEEIFKRGHKQGLLPEDYQLQGTPTPYDNPTVLDILCVPGFSSKEQADLTSGRGVGMAIVKSTVQQLGGILSLNTQLGQGTRFTIELPLTLAIIDALIIAIAGQIFAIPQTAVREVLQLDRQTITRFETNEMICYRDQVLPLLHLNTLLSWGEILPRPPEIQASDHPKVIVIGNGGNGVGLVVDHIIGLREIVVQALSDPFVQVFGIAGATELGDGRVVLILDVSALKSSKFAHSPLTHSIGGFSHDNRTL